MGKFTKRIIISVCILLISAIAGAQNVGIGTTNPQTKLQIAGALGFVADSAAAADADTIPDNVSVFRITYTGGGSRTGLIELNPKEGQLLTIYDEDDNDAIFAGNIIPAAGGIAYFMYLDGAWQLVSTNPITGPTGPTGATGTTGTNGTNGVTGPTGTAGANGSNGTNGSNGLTGPTGPTGSAGTNGTDGTDGSNGTNGTNGATWYTGTAAPSGGQGNVNDLYLNTATSEYYLKTGASTWTADGNLAGATGAAGTNGTNGVTGPTGATGTAGSANAWGLTGNTGTGAATNFIGTIDDNPWLIKTNNVERARIASYGDVVIGSGDSSSTVSGGILRAPGVWGGSGGATNTVGANLSITAGNGTGTAGSGSIIFKTAPAGSTGIAVDVMTEIMRITNTGALAFSGAANYGTSGNVLQSAGNAAPTWSALSLSNTSSVTGTLAVTNGGTGVTSLTTDGILYGGSTIGVTAAGTTNEVLIGNTGSAPSWTSMTSAAAGAFILNQTSQQTSSNFNISGNGTIGSLLTTQDFAGGLDTINIWQSSNTTVSLPSNVFMVVLYNDGGSSSKNITLELPDATTVGNGRTVIIRSAFDSNYTLIVASYNNSASQLVQTTKASTSNTSSISYGSGYQSGTMFISSYGMWFQIF